MNQKKDYVLRWIPKYSIIPLITALVLNTLVYSCLLYTSDAADE